MALRVCIPTAGTGSRLGEGTRYLNKSLVSVADRPILSHLIELFPGDTEFVIALGHKGHLVREFLGLAYPERHFVLVDVDPFEGPGSGLGLSLQKCRDHLQQPFIFLSCDTLVRESIPAFDQNWMGFAEQPHSSQYRSLEVEHDRVRSICEKGEPDHSRRKPYIGLAGIVDYQPFWEAMKSGGDGAIAMGEAYGLRALIDSGVRAERFTWFDTGNHEALSKTRDALRQPGSPTILEKPNEAIWFVQDRVIKFSDDRSFIANRVARAGHLGQSVPKIVGASDHMYAYERAPGRVLSEVVTQPLFERLLNEGEQFWKLHALSEGDDADFVEGCRRFYQDKTLERVALFYRTFGRADGTEAINDVPMPTLAELFDRIDWATLSHGTAGRFHGDFHFENILWSREEDRFTFLDWRQDFAGSLTVGDIYYDFAKLLHGLIVNHEIIHADQFSVSWETNAIRFDLLRKHSLVKCESVFMSWLDAHGYDGQKVRSLTALIYLNIAPLHHHPYSLLLYSLGKSLLAETLGQSS